MGTTLRICLFLVLSTLGIFARGQLVPRTTSSQNSLKSARSDYSFNAELLESNIYKAITDSFLNFKKQISVPLAAAFQSPVVLRHAGADYTGVYNNADYFGTPYLLNNMQITTSWELAGIPLYMGYRTSNWSQNMTGAFYFEFERAAYFNELRNKFVRRIDPKILLASLPDPLESLKAAAEKALAREISEINEEYRNLLDDKISALGEIRNLFYSRFEKINEELLSQTSLESFNEQQGLLEQLQTKINLGEMVDKEVVENLKLSIQQFEGAKKLIKAIERHQKNWEETGLLAKIREWDALKTNLFQKVISSSSLTREIARKHLNLNNLQRIFLKINQLKIGSNSLNLSPLTMQSFLNNGIATEFLNKGKSAMLFFGKSMEGASFLDMPFASSIFPSSRAMGFQLGKINKSGGSRFSLFSFNQGFNTIVNPSSMAGFKQSLVTGFGKEFIIRRTGILVAEVSRSLSNFNGKSGENGTSAKMLENLFSINDLGTNTSFHINYRDEIPKMALSYRMHVKRTALGYDNPGNPFLNSGSKEVGISVRKQFFKMLQVSVRSDFREFNFSSVPGNKWRNTASLFDMKWKLRKGQFLSVRYIPNRMIRYEGKEKQKTSVFDQLSFEGNVNRKIGSNYYSNYVSLFYQRNQYLANASFFKNTTFGFISNQTLSIKKLLLYWNTQINHSSSNVHLVYFNSVFNSEAGTSFGLLQRISASTSVAFNSVQNWYTQLGIRGNVSFGWNDRFQMNLYMDARKNLRIYHPVFFGLFHGGTSIRYIFK